MKSREAWNDRYSFQFHFRTAQGRSLQHSKRHCAVASLCDKNDTFREIIESPYHSTSGTNIHPDGITFYSTMFKNLSDTSVIDGEIKGGKTGTRVRHGHCLASFAEIDGVEYILVTAGAPGTGNPHIDDAVKLYNRLGESSSVLYGK